MLRANSLKRSMLILPKVQSNRLHLESTLQDLSLYDFQVESDHLGKEVEEHLETNPMLPGVILTEKGEFMGMISRRRFFEHLSRPYGLELFLNRSVKTLYHFVQDEVLICPGTTKIITAATTAVERSPEFFYEPIVVELAPRVYRLIDVHQLLLAQAQIHELATQLLKELYQQLEDANQELQHLATLDGLTQVPNRRRFDQYLDLEWRRLARERAPISLIMSDIDYFKCYNDTYGHQAGDDCLRQVANVLRGAIKTPADLVARYGGEEFAVILPNTNSTGAWVVAERIRSRIKLLQMPHPGSLTSQWVTLSLGIGTMIPSVQNTPTELIAIADAALYLAKKEGRDRCIMQTRSIHAE